LTEQSEELSGLVMKKNIFLFLFIAVLFFPDASLYARSNPLNILEKITFTKKGEQEETIEFKLNSTLIPKVFSIKGEKPRVVFDFFDTLSSGHIKHKINTKGDLIRRIRVGVHHKPKAKIRVVVDLVPGQPFDIAKEFIKKKNILLVTFTSPGYDGEPKEQSKLKKEEEPIQPVSTAVEIKKKKKTTSNTIEKISDLPPLKKVGEARKSGVDESKKTGGPFLSEVKFEDTSNKGEMVLFKLNDFYPPIVFGIEKGDPRVVCDFLGATLSKDVKRVIDTGGRFVKHIRLARHKNPDKIRVVLDLVPNSNYDLQQVFFKEDNLFVIIINPFAAEAQEAAN